MTRTDVMASSRPQNVSAAPMGRGSSGVLRRRSIVPVVLVLALMVIAPSTAFAAETTTGYNQTPPTPTTTETTPATTTSEPAKEVSPTTSTTPASSTSPAEEKSSTLPFTGFDLRWSLGIGLLLLLSGFSIVTVQRRQRRSER
jgi:hypothetical protein